MCEKRCVLRLDLKASRVELEDCRRDRGSCSTWMWQKQRKNENQRWTDLYLHCECNGKDQRQLHSFVRTGDVKTAE